MDYLIGEVESEYWADDRAVPDSVSVSVKFFGGMVRLENFPAGERVSLLSPCCGESFRRFRCSHCKRDRTVDSTIHNVYP